MINFLKIYSAHLKGSKKILIIASIGLICTLSIVSSTNYYFDNSKNQIIDEYFSNNIYNVPDASVNFLGAINNTKVLDPINKIVEATQSKFNLSYVKSINVIEAMVGLHIFVNYTDKPMNQFVTSVPIVELNTNLLNELKSINKLNPVMNNSQFPDPASKKLEIYYLLISYRSKGTVDPEAQLSLNASNYENIYIDSVETQLLNNVNVSVLVRTPFPALVTGESIVNMAPNVCTGQNQCTNNPSLQRYPGLASAINYLNPQVAPPRDPDPNLPPPPSAGGGIIFTNNLEQVLQAMNASGVTNPASVSDNNMDYSISITLNYYKIDPYSPNSIISDISGFELSLHDQLSKLTGLRSINSYFNAKETIQNLSSNFFNLIYNIFLLSLPVLIITIFITNFSFGLIYKNVVRHIGVFKSRGANSWLLFYIQIIDNILIICFSIAIAIFSGFPLAWLVIRSDFLLSFNYPISSYLIVNLPNVISLLLYSAVILTIIVNSKRVKILSQMQIIDTEKPAERQEPFWKRNYLDFVLFGLGLLMYAVFYSLTHNTIFQTVSGPIIIIFEILTLPGPFILGIGIVLLMNRSIPVILDRVGSFLWIRTGNLIALSFKNVNRHKQASMRATMLISLMLSFLFFFYSFPYSALINNQNNFYYTNGAEGVGQFQYGQIDQQALSILQTNFSQYLTSFSPYAILSRNDGNSNAYAMLFINTSTYLKTAYLNFDLGLNKSINYDLNHITIDKSNFNSSNFSVLNIIINSASLISQNQKIGSNFTFYSSYSKGGLKTNIVDTFDHWPILSPSFQQGNITAVADLNYYTNILNGNLKGSIFENTIPKAGVLFNFKDGVNQTLVSSWIEGNTSLRNFILESVQYQNYYNSVEFRLQLAQLNNNIIMTTIITLIVLLMFAYLQINERRKEIFTERAIGMKLHQVASSFFIETIILSLTSVLLGMGVGALLLELLGDLIFNPLQSYPPQILIFPFNIVLLTDFVILIFSGLISIIPAYYVSRQDNSRLFGEA